MNSWLSSGGSAGPESSRSPHPSVPQSPANVVFQPTARRRENVVQPPAITTSLSGLQHQGLGLVLSTPLSTTSLSSPFSQSQSYVSSPGGAVRGSSPMALRLTSPSYTVPYNPYNPQEWGPVGRSSPHMGPVLYPQANNGLRPPQHIPLQRPSDTVPSPPPPYSPPANRQQSQETAHQGNPAENTPMAPAPSQYATPTSSGPAAIPLEAVSRYSMPTPRPRPLSLIQLTDGDSGLHSPSFIPPPPPLPHGSQTSRSSSGNGSERHGFFNNLSSFGRRSRQFTAPGQTPDTEAQPATLAYADQPIRAPSSKRAASTGAIHNNHAWMTTTPQSISPPRRSWEAGMPLPPPPPGPPPVSNAQNTSVSQEPTRHLLQPTSLPQNRSPPVLGTRLDRIPPTPANWVDEETPQDRLALNNRSLHIDTTNVSTSPDPVVGTNSLGTAESSSSSQRPSSGLFRSAAIRDSSVKGIRERRIESRHIRHQVSEDHSAVSPSLNPWADALTMSPSHLVLPAANNSEAHRRVPKPSQLSAGSASSDDPPDTGRSRTSSGLFSNKSTASTPRPNPSPAPLYRNGFAQTPPFSPGGEPHSPTFAKEAMYVAPPKALPTPPPHSAQDLKSPTIVRSEDRPVSHLFHLPNDALPTPSPLSPRKISTQQPSPIDSVIRQETDFAREAVQRYQVFIEKEASAPSEAESLKLFAEFIISESHMRRSRYSNAFDAGSLNIEEVRGRLFEPPVKPTPQPERSMNRPRASPANRTSGEGTPAMPSSRPESAWWNNYQPCLSPIASMSNDEMSSRGRPPSRWWESKSSSGGGERKVQRSKRESKYMGVPRELREAMQWGYDKPLQEAEEEAEPGTSNPGPTVYGPDEYPPEKVGWHEEPSQPPQPPIVTQPYKDPGYLANTHKMDVSRLITLPPPYPRHHPAVNNSHPDLISYRTTVRSVSDITEIKATRHRHQSQAEDSLRSYQEKIQESRHRFKSNIQKQIVDGSISFAEAAEAEAALKVEEHRLEKDLVQTEFDSYQEKVLKPMRVILTDRIARATDCITELSSKLNDAAQHETPDQTQEEGDEEPELLEKLTQLKWLFDAREQLHREIFDLLSESNEKYRALVSLAYKQTKNDDKIHETDAFFIKDAMDRRVQHEADTLSRLESFMDVIEKNVKRGVEMHLSAFWDIAPSLLTLVQQIPEALQGFQVQIPANEYEENPSYHQFPFQYLYTLLSHAEKSTYQFIESQTNLLCLLHEAKSSVMSANCKLMEAQRIRHGEPEKVVQQEMREFNAQEERELTADLKDRVATVEGQWTEALGSQIQGARERVKSWLLAEGGWEELEQLEET